MPPWTRSAPTVAVAWKKAKARPLAEKAADDLAKQIKAKGATLKDSTVESYRVITIPPITRYQTSFLPTSMFEPSPVVETPIPDVPMPGEAFRNAYFSPPACRRRGRARTSPRPSITS